MTIASAPAETVNDLLKYALGVDVRQRGAMGMQTDISIRGGTYNQVAVLLDGINITDPQTGHNSFDFPVNLCDIERIEVLEDPPRGSMAPRPCWAPSTSSRERLRRTP